MECRKGVGGETILLKMSWAVNFLHHFQWEAFFEKSLALNLLEEEYTSAHVANL